MSPDHRIPAQRHGVANGTRSGNKTTVRSDWLLLLLAFVLLIGACTAIEDGSNPLPTATTSRPADPIPTATPRGTAPPTPSPKPTPTPTIQQAVSRITAVAQHTLQEENIEPLCLRWEDTDGDGTPEWLGMHLSGGDPPQLQAFVLDDRTWYDLDPTEGEKYGLGMYPTCQLEVDDINLDGQTEIAVWGRAETTLDLLHVFVWDGSHYREMASFQGDAGIRMNDVDGTPGDEIIVRHNAGNGLAWETVHRWDDTHYVWTWDRYQWLHIDHPHAYVRHTPERVVISFYLALEDRDLPGAYSLLAAEARASNAYQSWAAQFDTTLRVEVGSVYEIERREDAADVTAQVRSYDNIGGYIQGRLWDVTWLVVRENGSWRLSAGTTTELSEWQVPDID